MSTITSCPSCGQKLSPPEPGGVATCSNPNCGQPAGAAGRSGVLGNGPVAVRTGPRPAGARPELLDRIPQSFWISPPMVAVGGVGVALYGMVLFAVLSSRRNLPEPDPPPRVDSLAYARVTPLPIEVEPKPSPAPPPAPGKAAEKPEAVGKAKGAQKKQKTKAARAAAPAAAGTANATPKQAEAAPTTHEANATPGKAEIARATLTPAPTAPTAAAVTPTPAPPSEPKAPSWGALVAAPTDCPIRVDAEGLAITLAGGALHVFSPELRTMNAPRLLTKVAGDFTVQVSVLGKRLLPGTVPLGKLPFTFQGAGLLLWVDESHYLVLERTSYYSIVERKRLHRVLFEYRHDGKVSTDYRDTRDAEITVKLVREGEVIRAQYTPDGRNWIDVKRLHVSLPEEVQVGVSASNASPKAYEARLDGFELSRGAGG